MCRPVRSLFSLLSALCALLLLEGCFHPFYISPSPCIPLLKDSGQLVIEPTVNYNSNFLGGKLDAAYALNGRLGFTANLLYAGGGGYVPGTRAEFDLFNFGADEPEGQLSRMGSADLGAGYHRAFGQKGVFEVYGGYGYALQHHVYSEYQGADAFVHQHRLFVQPNIGLVLPDEKFELGFGLRLSGLHYRVQEPAPAAVFEGRLGYLDRHPNHVIAEPSVMLRGGPSPYFKFYVQLTYLGASRDYLVVDPFTMCSGFTISLAPRYRQNPRYKKLDPGEPRYKGWGRER